MYCWNQTFKDLETLELNSRAARIELTKSSCNKWEADQIKDGIELVEI